MAQQEWVVGGGIWVTNNSGGVVGSLLEWIFCSPLPKLGIGSVVGDALVSLLIGGIKKHGSRCIFCLVAVFNSYVQCQNLSKVSSTKKNVKHLLLMHVMPV
jgi:hypothetical protein